MKTLLSLLLFPALLAFGQFDPFGAPPKSSDIQKKMQLIEAKRAEIAKQMQELEAASRKVRAEYKSTHEATTKAKQALQMPRQLAAMPALMGLQIGIVVDPRGKGGVKVKDPMPDSVAEKAGVQAGDLIHDINGIKIEQIYALQQIINAAGEQPLKFGITRGDEKLALTITPSKSPMPQMLKSAWPAGKSATLTPVKPVPGRFVKPVQSNADVKRLEQEVKAIRAELKKISAKLSVDSSDAPAKPKKKSADPFE